jgi:hypothetical protein
MTQIERARTAIKPEPLYVPLATIKTLGTEDQPLVLAGIKDNSGNNDTKVEFLSSGKSKLIPVIQEKPYANNLMRRVAKELAGSQSTAYSAYRTLGGLQNELPGHTKEAFDAGVAASKSPFVSSRGAELYLVDDARKTMARLAASPAAPALHAIGAQVSSHPSPLGGPVAEGMPTGLKPLAGIPVGLPMDAATEEPGPKVFSVAGALGTDAGEPAPHVVSGGGRSPASAAAGSKGPLGGIAALLARPKPTEAGAVTTPPVLPVKIGGQMPVPPNITGLPGPPIAPALGGNGEPARYLPHPVGSLEGYRTTSVVEGASKVGGRAKYAALAVIGGLALADGLVVGAGSDSSPKRGLATGVFVAGGGLTALMLAKLATPSAATGKAALNLGSKFGSKLFIAAAAGAGVTLLAANLLPNADAKLGARQATIGTLAASIGVGAVTAVAARQAAKAAGTEVLAGGGRGAALVAVAALAGGAASTLVGLALKAAAPATIVKPASAKPTTPAGNK